MNIDGDFIESELIGYLSARTFYNLPITFSSTTGVVKDMCGGKIYFYKNPFDYLYQKELLHCIWQKFCNIRKWKDLLKLNASA